jgi:hypothetical protein
MQSLSLHAHPSIEMMEKVLQETPVGVEEQNLSEKNAND